MQYLLINSLLFLVFSRDLLAVSVLPSLCVHSNKLNTLPVKIDAFEVFTGSNSETVKTVLNKFFDGD